ncbi:Beta-lactamase enzyme family protein [Saccharopolyspora antimicrobica]|uniref:Beta-lactamase n=1 Tax=Saccharopolyspora antimicrobica TaxID=455193 RepID=A0A1I5JGY9_9PSEU|nr:serine hydrolase [Saccharopolyspora antimicrobica]RKT82520.1 beta-lactamase family protein [Saccharopolyspora antimicrobica]SFO71636.1 Beta-lactamase enzyme family protein [Saccharopolyspora antimicrobica]
MLLSRRHLLVTAAAVTPLLLAPSALAQPAPAPPDLSTPEGWLAWISAHRDQLGLVLDDGRGNHLQHRPHAAQPLASAVKVVHLAAYATAVADGRLDPAEQVRVGDWESFYVPTDGFAHVNALQHLGIPTDPTGLRATDPEHRVALDDMVSAMITFSDSAAPDFIRDRLGEPALRKAAAAGGWHRPDIRSMCAEYLFLLPEFAPPAQLPTPARRAWGYRLERRFSTDAALREQVVDRLLRNGLPPHEHQLSWAGRTMSSTAAELAALHRAIATDDFPSEAAAVARTHLERPLSGHLPPGVLGIGLKGGSLPGVLTCGLTVRHADGTTASGALLAHGDISPEQLGNGDPGLPLLLAMQQPEWRDRLARALRA